jgi:hypothetical protein
VSDNVTAIYGGATGEREVSDACVDLLEDLLERAKSGEVVGFSGACLGHDNVATFAIGGRCGGVGMVGALEACKYMLTRDNISD